MAAALELAKIIGSSWLYRNWVHASVAIKTYLSAAIVILICISSLGVFGYLSKAHIEQEVHTQQTVGVDKGILGAKIEEKKRALDDTTRSIEQIDKQISTVLGRTNDRNPLNTQKTVDSLNKQRAVVSAQRDLRASELTGLQSQLARSDAEGKKLEAEVGPLKYIAQLVYGDSASTDDLERTVRWVIIILVSVFDPLAIALLIAANDGFIREKVSTGSGEDGIVRVSQEDIRHMN